MIKFNVDAFGSRKKLTATLDNASRPVRGIWPRLSDALLGLFSLVVVLFVLSTYSTTLATAASKLVSHDKYLALIDGMVNPYRTRHLLLNSGLPVYDLKIKRSEMIKVEDAVERAKKQGWLSDDMKVWVPANFFHEGKKYNVQVRVRGDSSAHWEGAKKSWAVKFGKEKVGEGENAHKEAGSFQGKRRINLIIPSDKDFVVGKFVNDVLRDYGLVAQRDQFAIVRINGTVQGLYYEVEDVDTGMLAASRRPETTTVFGQTDRAMHFEQYTKLGTPIPSDAQYDVGTMRRSVDRNGELAMRAMQVLIDHSLDPTPDKFRRARAVLDWEKYLRFRNMTTIFNTNHVRFGSDNFRLQLDQSRGLLEPVPWDLHTTRMPDEPGTIDFWNMHGPDELQKATLTDPALRLERNRLLWEQVSDGGEQFLARYNKLHERIRPIAWADVLATPIEGYKMDVIQRTLEHNVHRIHKVLSSSNSTLTYTLVADDRAELDVAALNFGGIELSAVDLKDEKVFDGAYRLYEDANDNGQLDDSDPLVVETTAADGQIHLEWPEPKVILPNVDFGSGPIGGGEWTYFDTFAKRSRFFLVGKLAPAVRGPLEWSRPKVDAAVTNAVTGREVPATPSDSNKQPASDSIGITAYNASDPFDLAAPELSLDEFLQRHPQFTASRDRHGAAELAGSVTISGAVIVPKRVPLVLRPGTDITMMPHAIVLCYGGLQAIGTADDRIRIHDDGSIASELSAGGLNHADDHIRIHDDGSGAAWNTFAVVRPPEEVVMEFVDIQGGGQARINSMLFTGGFAVYDGDVRLEHCRITDMRSEDGMNIKNGRIIMKECLISGTASDELDLDFCTGEIRDCVFINSGRGTNNGDGVDISGSSVTIVGNRFENITDKGISVGENSHPIIANNLFLHCNIAIACKDLSHPRVAYCTFIENKLAIEAKRKKEWYGPGSGEFANCVFSGNKTLLKEDDFSKGNVHVHHSLVDETVGWPNCSKVSPRFVAPDANDFRLDTSVLSTLGFVPAVIDWADEAGLRELPQVPGVITHMEPMRELK